MEAQMADQKLNVVDYSEKSFVVWGELTRQYKDHLKGFGGRFNGRLRQVGDFTTGKGWVFGLKNKDSILEFVEKVNPGEISPTDLPQNTGDGSLPTVNAPKSTTYQWVKFRIFKPQTGMRVLLKVNNQEVVGEVTSTEQHNNITDTVYIDFNGKTSMGVIQNGKWKILGYMADHTLFFTDQE